MVGQKERDDVTWYVCEGCGLMFEDQHEAREHEQCCDHEEPAYIQ